MSRVLTGDKMISSIRKRTMCPDDTSIFTDQDILDITNEELDVQVLEKLLTLHEEHITVHVDIPRNDAGVYDIPVRAVGNKIRDIQLINGGSSSNNNDGAYVYELTQISIGELPDYSYSIDSSTYMDKFFVESNQIKIMNPTRSYETIRIYFYIRPNVLTKLENAGIVSDIITDTGAGTVTLVMSQVGKSFTSTDIYDIVGKKTPNKIKGWDLTPVSVTTGSSGSIVFNLSDVESFIGEVIVGDYVTLEEESPVPNIPTEMHPILAQACAINILESLGDTEALTNAQKRMDKMTTAVQSIVDDRVELAPKKIKPRHGPLNQVLGRNRRSRGNF